MAITTDNHTSKVDASKQKYSDILKESPRMFENEYLDSFTRVGPLQVILVYVPIILYLTINGCSIVTRSQSASTYNDVYKYWTGGFIVWTLSEYWLHRVVFHFDAPYEWAHKMHFMIHGVHHDHPHDKQRLLMPPMASMPIASAFGFLFRTIFDNGMWQLFLAGWLFGYICYDLLHYHFHFNKPLTFVDQFLRQNHMRHHFVDHSKGFGVSSPLWDFVFFTTPTMK